MADRPLKLLVLGAHPDDADLHAGGLSACYRRLGHEVRLISVTNGEAGHQTQFGPELAARRKAEAKAAGEVIGAVYETWDFPDGQLQPTLEVRSRIIRELRTFAPDLVLTHRPDDYHPDHRAVGHAVRDASYMVTVPGVVRDVPALSKDPVVAYMMDRFTKPTPLQGDVVLDLEPYVDTVADMLHCHTSQMYEWLPYNCGIANTVPADDAGRRAWVKDWYLGRIRGFPDRYRQELIRTYGPVRGSQIRYAEVYEISEYACQLDLSARRKLFPHEH